MTSEETTENRRKITSEDVDEVLTIIGDRIEQWLEGIPDGFAQFFRDLFTPRVWKKTLIGCYRIFRPMEWSDLFYSKSMWYVITIVMLIITYDWFGLKSDVTVYLDVLLGYGLPIIIFYEASMIVKDMVLMIISNLLDPIDKRLIKKEKEE